jgi:oxygen-independent coproporphyrinogen-3 oxidase
VTGLYVHLPFCVKKCHYCDFVIAVGGDAERHGKFLDALDGEMEARAERFKNTEFDTLYLGGGTPSTLSPEETKRFFDSLRGRFRLKEGAEITCEVNPGDVDAAKAKLYRSLGVGRVSLGAQTFREATLRRLNRAHGSVDIGRSYGLLREAGIVNVSLDLILALPGETMEDVEFSLDCLTGLSPEHVSIYELAIEEKTVFGREHREGRLERPSEELQLKMLTTVRERLKAVGYTHYELLSYAKPGFESKHNLLYWANADYLGLGPGAFSFYDGRRFRVAASFDDYMKKAAQNDFSACEEEILDSSRREFESLVLALRLTRGAKIADFQRPLAALTDTIAELKMKDLVSVDAERIRLTEKGQLFAESVFADLSSPDPL